MKTAIKLSTGERVSVSEFETRDQQIRVFYSDGSDDYENVEDLEIGEDIPIAFYIDTTIQRRGNDVTMYFYEVPGGFIEEDGEVTNFTSMTKEELINIYSHENTD